MSGRDTVIGYDSDGVGYAEPTTCANVTNTGSGTVSALKLLSL